MGEPGRHLAIALLAAMLLVACGGGDETRPEVTESPAGDMQTEAPGADIVLTGTDSLEFVPPQVEAEAGTVSVALTPEGTPHTFTIELDEGDETVVQAFTAGQAAVGEIELEAGTYVFYCAIGGHREAGMEGTLTVS